MDEPRDYHAKRTKSEERQIWFPLYVESKKNDTNELIYKIDTNVWLPEGKGIEGWTGNLWLTDIHYYI